MCLIILYPNIMTESLLHLGFLFGWSCSADFHQIVLPLFSILDFFVFSLDIGGTSVLVIVCVIFCAFVLLLMKSLD